MRGMRSFLIGAVIAVVVVLVGLWLFTSRWGALLVDQFYTPRLATLQSNPIGWNGTWLQLGPPVSNLMGPAGWSGPDLLIGGHVLDFGGPGPDYRQVADLEVDADGQLVLHYDGKSFVFGSRAGTWYSGSDAIPTFAAGPGDTTSVVLECSLLSWPAPFEFNFMTGGSRPTWQRNLYYRLSWRKPSGAQLAIVWRHRQNYYSEIGWSGSMVIEVLRIDIRPAPAPHPAP